MLTVCWTHVMVVCTYHLGLPYRTAIHNPPVQADTPSPFIEMLHFTHRFFKTTIQRSSLKAKARFASSNWSPRDAGPNDEELNAARTWLARLNSMTVPRTICRISYSRSSGPGGQHVNKYIQILPLGAAIQG